MDMLELYSKRFRDVAFGVACGVDRVFATCFWEKPQEVVASLRQAVPMDVPVQVSDKPSVFAEKVCSAMRDIYAGKGTKENLPLSLERFPAYTQRVIRAVCHIPVGYVASYGGVAEAVGGGARAVGNVMANNAFAPIVPCHRVVTASLGLGGYGGGLRVKYEFLKREKRGYTKPLEIPVGGGVLSVFPVEFVLKKLENDGAQKRL
jgi:O-6-methylguanine DNA methyltransferase